MCITLQISGDGMLDPAVSSTRPTLRTAYNNLESNSSESIIFYSSEEDPTANFLITPLNFKKKINITPVSTAEGGIIAATVLAILIILIIIILVAYLMTRDRGETYIIDEKERAQGHNPEQELKDEQFKEYQRPEEGPIRGSRMSLASSIRVGSDDEGELDEYGEIDAGELSILLLLMLGVTFQCD